MTKRSRSPGCLRVCAVVLDSRRLLVANYAGTEPPIIDLTGGQPDLVPEWALWMMREMIVRRLEKQCIPLVRRPQH